MESIERTSCYDTEEDIKPKGFEIISLGDEIKVNPSGLVLISNKDIEDTTDQTIQLLIDQYIYEKCIEHKMALSPILTGVRYRQVRAPCWQMPNRDKPEPILSILSCKFVCRRPIYD